MTIAFNALLDLARIVGPATESVATGGSSTTIVDSGLGGSDDEWNGGTAFIITDAGGASAAPENECGRVSDYVASTGTLTIRTSDLTAAPASGDTYAVCKVPRHELYQAVNAALRDVGPLAYEDDTTLDTAANTLEYTLPAAARYDVRQIWIATNTTTPYDYQENHYWRVILNKTTYNLIFTAEPPASRNIRIVYCAKHAEVKTASATIDATAPYDYVIWRAAYHTYRRRQHQVGREDNKWVGLMNEAAEYAAQALQKHPILLPDRSTRFAYWPETEIPYDGVIETTPVATA
jgi:hypothetical protein